MQHSAPSDFDKMLCLAREAQQHAYAPYSHFFVGCCIKTTNGEFFSGANVENVSYSLTACAERAACTAMVNAGYRQIADIIVVSSNDIICPPCGGCRQFLFEFSQKNTMVHLCNNKGLQRSVLLSDLLPLAFMDNHMKPQQPHT